jgi:hypothetical protein
VVRAISIKMNFLAPNMPNYTAKKPYEHVANLLKSSKPGSRTNLF